MVCKDHAATDLTCIINQSELRYWNEVRPLPDPHRVSLLVTQPTGQSRANYAGYEYRSRGPFVELIHSFCHTPGRTVISILPWTSTLTLGSSGNLEYTSTSVGRDKSGDYTPLETGFLL